MEKIGTQEMIVLILTFCSTHFIISAADDISENDLDKRAPGWGKRDSIPAERLGYLDSVISELSRYDSEKDESLDLDLDKRRPGWGKRAGFDTSGDDDLSMNKRRPGWGKRSYDFDIDSMETKRAPGWGKRSFSSDDDFSTETMEKRRPGWGKRSLYSELQMFKRRPGWGKRAPGWGKRSVGSTNRCDSLLSDIKILRLKLYELTEALPDVCPNPLMAEADGTK